MFNKLLFFFKKPKVVLVAGNGAKTSQEAIVKVVSRRFSVGKEIIVCGSDDKDAEFFLKRSPLPVLVSTHIGEYHPEKEFFAGDIKDAKKIKETAFLLGPQGHLVLNFDDETVRELKDKSSAHPFTFGFGLRSDVRASDIVITQFPALGTNFKFNYDGNIVPCWLKNLFGKENIYAALSAAAVGLILGMNLVEISEALKDFKGMAGRMSLVGGIKNSWVLDDSESASSLSMLESLKVLKSIEGDGRKIAVLGDILAVGKYALEAHETVGEKVMGSCDLLFTVGERAKFFAQGAKNKGMAEDKIFQFDDAASAGKALQNEIRENDLILVDGSREMSMMAIVEEIKSGPIV